MNLGGLALSGGLLGLGFYLVATRNTAEKEKGGAGMVTRNLPALDSRNATTQPKNTYNITMPEPKNDTLSLSDVSKTGTSKKDNDSKKQSVYTSGNKFNDFVKSGDGGFVGAPKPSTVTQQTKKEIESTVDKSDSFMTAGKEYSTVPDKYKMSVPNFNEPTKKETEIKSFEVGKDTKIPEEN